MVYHIFAYTSGKRTTSWIYNFESRFSTLPWPKSTLLFSITVVRWAAWTYEIATCLGKLGRWNATSVHLMKCCVSFASFFLIPPIATRGTYLTRPITLRMPIPKHLRKQRTEDTQRTTTNEDSARRGQQPKAENAINVGDQWCGGATTKNRGINEDDDQERRTHDWEQTTHDRDALVWLMQLAGRVRDWC